MIVDSLVEWLREVDLKTQKTGFFHSLRLLLQGLMANPECSDDDAPQLGKVLAEINELHRARSHDAEASRLVGRRCLVCTAGELRGGLVVALV